MNLADCGSATIAFSGKAGIGIAYVFSSLFSSVVFLRLGEAVRICYSCLCLNRSRVDDVLFHPLLDDNTRSQELNERGGLHWRGISDSDKEEFLNFQLLIEKGIERALLSDGYSRASLNDKNIRYKIWGFFLVLPQGDPSF